MIFNRKRKTQTQKTQRLSLDSDKSKSIPSVCSSCGKIYKIGTWEVERGRRTGVSHGLCRNCYDKLKESVDAMDGEIDRTQKIPRTWRDDKSVPSICSYCGKIYKISKWSVEEGKKIGVSHGLCPECFEREKEKIAKP